MNLPLPILGLLAATTIASALTEGELLIWINGDKGYRGLGEVAKKFEQDLGIKVRIEVPEDASNKFQQAAQSGKGPDIFFWAHDRVGEWSSAGLLRPIEVDDAFRGRFEEKGWEAFTQDGKLWGYPLALESVSLIYNKELIKEPPSQISGIAPISKQLKALSPRNSAILWDYNNTYFTWGVLASGGAYVFGREDDNYDTSDVGVNAPGSIKALDEIVGLIDQGIMARGATYSVMETQMNKGQLGMMISGPWAWRNLRSSGIDFGVAAIPGTAGEPGRPFVGVLGAVLNRASPNHFLAEEFLVHYVLTPEGLGAIDADVPLGIPAHKAFYQQLASSNELIRSSRVNVDNGLLMPAVPEMGRFWSAMEAALEIATNGQASAERALDDAATNMTK